MPMEDIRKPTPSLEPLFDPCAAQKFFGLTDTRELRNQTLVWFPGYGLVLLIRGFMKPAELAKSNQIIIRSCYHPCRQTTPCGSSRLQSSMAPCGTCGIHPHSPRRPSSLSTREKAARRKFTGRAGYDAADDAGGSESAGEQLRALFRAGQLRRAVQAVPTENQHGPESCRSDISTAPCRPTPPTPRRVLHQIRSLVLNAD